MQVYHQSIVIQLALDTLLTDRVLIYFQSQITSRFLDPKAFYRELVTPCSNYGFLQDQFSSLTLNVHRRWSRVGYPIIFCYIYLWSPGTNFCSTQLCFLKALPFRVVGEFNSKVPRSSFPTTEQSVSSLCFVDSLSFPKPRFSQKNDNTNFSYLTLSPTKTTAW